MEVGSTVSRRGNGCDGEGSTRLVPEELLVVNDEVDLPADEQVGLVGLVVLVDVVVEVLGEGC